MDHALIVSAAPKAHIRIAAWLGDGWTVAWARDAAQAMGMAREKAYNLLIINAPLRDSDENALCALRDMDVLYLAPEASYEAICQRLNPRGIFVLSKPVSPHLFTQTIAILAAARAKLSRLQGRLEEVRVVERAKWALIRTLNMTEAQAHRYIEKQAMDLRITRRAVAENIVKTYEN